MPTAPPTFLGADYYVVANGGWQLCYTVSPSYTIQRIYPYATMRDTTSAGRYDFSWKPQVVVINLGTNDWARTQAEIQENVWGFWRWCARKNPDAAIVWAYGAMDHDHPSVAWIKAAVETFARQDKNAYFVHLPGEHIGLGEPPPMCRDKPRLPKCSQKKSGPLWAGRRAHYEESSCCFWDFCAGRPPLCACCLRGGDSRVDGAVRSRGITGTSPLPSPLAHCRREPASLTPKSSFPCSRAISVCGKIPFPGCRRMRGVWCRRSGIRAAFSCFWSPKMPPLRDLTHSRCFTRLQNKTGGKTGPVFQITYILIDRAGKETLYTGLCETSGQNQPGSSGEDSSLQGAGPFRFPLTYPLLWKARARGSISPVKMRISAPPYPAGSIRS